MKIRVLTIILLFSSQLTGCLEPLAARSSAGVEAVSGLIKLGSAGISVTTDLLSDDGGQIGTNSDLDKRFLKKGSAGYEELLTEAESISESNYSEILLTKDNVRIYYIPSVAGEVLTNLYNYNGSDKVCLTALRESSNWVEVETPSGDTGWVLKEEIDFSKSSKRNQNTN